MGNIYFGIPEHTTLFLKKLLELNIFIEGGTYLGNTAKKMSLFFERVYTIENSEIMYNKAKENLKDIKNIILLKGDTREYLNKIIQENNNILLWLDSHWSGGDTYGKDDECSLLKELEIIFNYKRNYVILIDDARLFLAPPPLPHNFRNWPNIKDIIKKIPSDFDVIILDDVIYIFPDLVSEKFKNYIQQYLKKVSNKKKVERNKLIYNKRNFYKCF